MWRFVVATLEMKRFQDDAHSKKDVFHREKKSLMIMMTTTTWMMM